ESAASTAIPVGPAPLEARPAPPPAEPRVEAVPVGDPVPANGGAPREDAVPMVSPVAAAAPIVAPAEAEIDDGEADAQAVRRHMATASQSFDPDHQIRRAMDAFLSPPSPDRERRAPDHQA
ncbi:MAG TPA: hypothetical protein VI277_01450, partial [Candidatus Limnocylindria bacterium]